MVILGFLVLYKPYINLQKPTSDLGYKYWIPRSLHTLPDHLPRVGGALESSETHNASEGFP